MLLPNGLFDVLLLRLPVLLSAAGWDASPGKRFKLVGFGPIKRISNLMKLLEKMSNERTSEISIPKLMYRVLSGQNISRPKEIKAVHNKKNKDVYMYIVAKHLSDFPGLLYVIIQTV